MLSWMYSKCHDLQVSLTHKLLFKFLSQVSMAPQIPFQQGEEQKANIVTLKLSNHWIIK